ncbi:replication fork protection component Swi3-domain-containing protein [Syncephalis fuscata]|nr:replication fork protection component Swi3-domain-containing protein [Syncephalis fuscata]
MEEGYEPLDAYDVPILSTENEENLAQSTTQITEEPDKPRVIRRPMAKLDADRLLSDKGLPWIKVNSRRVKLAGKGHHTEDLKKILRFYEMWAHKLYPRYGFREFVMRAEKVCHHKRMQMHLRTWQAEMRSVSVDQSTEQLEEEICDMEPINDEIEETSTDTLPTTTTTEIVNTKTRQQQKWILFDDEEDQEDQSINLNSHSLPEQITIESNHNNNINNIDNDDNDDDDNDDVMSDASIEL